MKQSMDNKELFLECACHSPDHLVRYSLWSWLGGEPELSLMVQASEYRPWYHRIGVGLKYIFGVEPLRWHDVLLKREDADKLMEMLEEYKRLNAVYEECQENG